MDLILRTPEMTEATEQSMRRSQRMVTSSSAANPASA
jgi:hypothetical protein